MVGTGLQCNNIRI